MDEFTKIRYNIILGRNPLIDLGLDSIFTNMKLQEVMDHKKGVQYLWSTLVSTYLNH